MRGVSPYPVLALSLAFGCYGGSEAGGPADGSGAGTSSETMTGGDGDEGADAGAHDDGAVPDDLDPLSVPEPLAARLTDVQYEYTILDLFGQALTDQERDWLPVTSFIPGRYATGVTSQDFADDYVVGYARIARSLSGRVEADEVLSTYGGCDSIQTDCLESMIKGLGRRLARHPLSDEMVAQYLELAAAIADSEHTGDEHIVPGIVQAMLQSPQFLYRLEIENNRDGGEVRRATGWELASRLSYFLWLSAPDEALLEFAAGPDGDGVFDEGQRLEQIDRMIADPRFERAREMFWGDYSLMSTSSFSTVDPELGQDLRRSLMASLRWLSGGEGEESPPLSALLDTTMMMMTPSVAELAGVEPQGDGLELYANIPDRLGLITHPAFIAAMGTTSFVGRGVFLTERLLCQHIAPPPSDDDTATQIEQTEQATTDLTPREASEFRLGLEPVCLSCHTQFEPIAYAFERYDASGRYGLVDDQDRELFSDGVLPPFMDRPEIPFASASELLRALVEEPAIGRCLIENMMEFGFGARPRNAEHFVLDAYEHYQTEGETFEALVRSVARSERLTFLRTVAQ